MFSPLSVFHPLCNVSTLFSSFTRLVFSSKVPSYDPGPVQGFFLFVFKHFDIMRPRRHLTVSLQYLAITRLQTGCFQREIATDLRVSQSVISKLQKRHRKTEGVTEGDLLCPHPILMTASLWTVTCWGFFVLVYPPLLLPFVSLNSLKWRNYHSMLLLKCPTFMI